MTREIASTEPSQSSPHQHSGRRSLGKASKQEFSKGNICALDSISFTVRPPRPSYDVWNPAASRNIAPPLQIPVLELFATDMQYVFYKTAQGFWVWTCLLQNIFFFALPMENLGI